MSAFSQPEPCDLSNPFMTPRCEDCCIICDIDGFTGRHSGFEDGEDPPGFAGECTQVAHNMRWIAFVAGSVNLKVELAVSNCVLGHGLEFGLYKGNDCTDYVRISNCFGGFNSIPPGNSGVIENNEPLVIGQYYYIVMDGALEDNCDWTFNVVEGSTALMPLDETSPIEGLDPICPFVLQSYFTQPMEGATLFYWTLDGIPLGDINLNTVDVLIPTAGSYTLCCTAANACDEAIPACREIEVKEISDTFIVEEFCSGDCYENNGTTYCETGIYDFTINLENGCDSTVILDLTELPQPENFLDINICEGESIIIDGTSYSETGVFDQLIQSPESCDSIVYLDLFVVVCVIISEATAVSPICHGEANGQIDFQVIQGTPPFSYSWTHLNSGTIGSGNIDNLNDSEIITGVQAGTYVIEIMDNFGDFDIIIQEVDEPEQLEVFLTSSSFNGFNLSCFDSDDGVLDAISSGGIPPYQYEWSIGLNSQNLNNLPEDTYILTVTDDVGCQVISDIELIAPEPLDLQVDFVNPSCESLSSGLVELIDLSGGSPPYVFDLNGNGFGENQIFENLSGGEYAFTAMDANGCLISLTETLIEPDIPNLSGLDAYNINLGDSILFQVDLNEIETADILWSPTEGLSCSDCLDPIARPFNSTNYILTVVSEDNCIDTFNIFVGVEKTRAFYPPNVFSPNGDNINDYFSLIGSSEVTEMHLRIFDRWGNILFDENAIAPLGERLGWDGRTDSGYANPGVYVWMAEITFLDGETFTYQGDVTVVR